MSLRDDIFAAFHRFEAARRSAVYTGRMAWAVGGVTTDQVRNELKRMEADGLVRRVYEKSAINELCWERVK